MKIVNTGAQYDVFGDDLRTYDELPPNIYKVCFMKNHGFFLELHDPIEVKEKIYGPHQRKVDKILAAFPKFNRSLGVILSGNKGIGKSICAKLIAKKSVEVGLPVVLVDKYFPGIADFISSIKQEIVVLFDEFDKTFRSVGRDEEVRPQDTMLSLFDGTDMGKKLFVVTCNELDGLNSFLVNRPGRFHYHLRFNYPNFEEIREYMLDNVPSECRGEIEKVVKFSGRVPLNYDCLRAIAFELSNGETFEDAISDLNIVVSDSNQKFEGFMFTDVEGVVGVNKEVRTNFDEAGRQYVCFDLPDRTSVSLSFNCRDANYDYAEGGFIIDGSDTDGECWYDSRGNDIEDTSKMPHITKVVFKRKFSVDDGLHYRFTV